MIKLPQNALYVINVLEQNGFEAFAVGGIVRDIIMNRPSCDIDIATSASPEDIIKAFVGHRIIPTGLKHGTVTVIIEDENIEITTFRTESGYSDNRHPDSVSFCKSITDDLSRRDFTINALAFNDRLGIIDLFGGIEDIQKGIIKTVGDPLCRFSEDTLRIMRACRFSAQLGFKIDKATLAAMKQLSKKLCGISAERLYSELIKLLSGPYCKNALIIMKQCKILSDIIPLANDNIINVTDSLTSVNMRLAALLLEAHSPKCCLDSLKADTHTAKEVLAFIEASKAAPLQSKGEIKRYIGKKGYENSINEYCFISTVFPERKKDCDFFFDTAAEILTSDACCKISDLAINGNDIRLIGASGKQTGIILDKLLFSVTENRLCNEKQVLINAAKDILKAL